MKRLSIVTTMAAAALSSTGVLAEPLVIRTDDCRDIVSHVPADDVTYRPGVDVNGRPVVPADLGGGYGITAPEEVTIDIRLDLANRLPLGGSDGPGGGAASATIGGESVIGQVTVRGNDMYWNGQLIPRDAHTALASACMDAFAAANIPLPLPKPDPAED